MSSARTLTEGKKRASSHEHIRRSPSASRCSNKEYAFRRSLLRRDWTQQVCVRGNTDFAHNFLKTIVAVRAFDRANLRAHPSTLNSQFPTRLGDISTLAADVPHPPPRRTVIPDQMFQFISPYALLALSRFRCFHCTGPVGDSVFKVQPSLHGCERAAILFCGC